MKCGPDGDDNELVGMLLPLTAFFQQRAGAAAASLGDHYEMADNLLDVLCEMWRLAMSIPAATSSTALWEQVGKFRVACVDDLEMYADWSWFEMYEQDAFVPVSRGEIAASLELVVRTYLAGRFPWQKDDISQLLQRQSDFLISTEMIEAVKTSSEAIDTLGLDQPAPRLRQLTKTPSGVISKLRSIR